MSPIQFHSSNIIDVNHKHKIKHNNFAYIFTNATRIPPNVLLRVFFKLNFDRSVLGNPGPSGSLPHQIHQDLPPPSPPPITSVNKTKMLALRMGAFRSLQEWLSTISLWRVTQMYATHSALRSFKQLLCSVNMAEEVLEFASNLDVSFNHSANGQAGRSLGQGGQPLPRSVLRSSYLYFWFSVLWVLLACSLCFLDGFLFVALQYMSLMLSSF